MIVLKAWLGLVPHTLVKQLLWLLLWACVSLSCMLMVRLLVFYDGFAVPSFLALLSAALVAVLARVFVYLHGSTEDKSGSSMSRSWLHLCLVGALMGASGGLNLASFRYLPVPTVILIQAAAPAASYWASVLLLQEDVQWSAGLRALLVFLSAAAALLPQRNSISTTGLALQGTAVMLEALWQRLHLGAAGSNSAGSCAYDSVGSNSSARSHQSNGSSTGSSCAYESSGSNSNTRSHQSNGSSSAAAGPSGLQLLADAAPAAVLTLLPAMLVFDLEPWRVQQFMFKPMLPAAFVVCVFICGLVLLKAQAEVLQGLALEPTGALMRTLRDVLLGVAAAKLLNESLTPWQWAAYALAQVAAVLLWAGGSSSSSSGIIAGSKKAGGVRLLPIWG